MEYLYLILIIQPYTFTHVYLISCGRTETTLIDIVPTGSGLDFVNSTIVLHNKFIISSLMHILYRILCLCFFAGKLLGEKANQFKNLRYFFFIDTITLLI